MTLQKSLLILLLSFAGLGPCLAQQQSPVTTQRPSPSIAGANQQVPPTKKVAGYCVPPGSPDYARIKDFVPFVTVQDCLKSGGLLPKR